MGISREQALDCFRSDDLVGIGMEADAVRRRLHPEGVVSYAMECGIDCAEVMRAGTNPVVGCAHQLFDAVGEAAEIGVAGVRLRFGDERELTTGTEWLEGLLRGIK